MSEEVDSYTDEHAIDADKLGVSRKVCKACYRDYFRERSEVTLGS